MQDPLKQIFWRSLPRRPFVSAYRRLSAEPPVEGSEPERIDIVFVNGDPDPGRPDLPAFGAGEAAIRPTIAAIVNAIYDATGVRIRRVPFRDARVLEALRAAGV